MKLKQTMTTNELQRNAGINDCHDSQSAKETREGSIDPNHLGRNQTKCQEEATFRHSIIEEKCITVQLVSARAQTNNGGLGLHLLYLLLTGCQAPLNRRTICMALYTLLLNHLLTYLLTYSLTYCVCDFCCICLNIPETSFYRQA